MAIKICLDAGHYSNYNPSPVYSPYKEGNMTFKLQTYLKAELESYGFTVGITKTSASQDVSLYNRGAKAKGYDLFLSLHSNACSTPSVKRVVVIKGYDQPNTLADKFGKCISEAMGITEKYQIMTRKGTSGSEYYGVLRGAKAVGVANRFILEHGFHTNKEVAQWLYQDSNLKKLAKAIADMLAQHYGYKKTTTTPPTNDTGFKQYIVRVKEDLNGREKASASSKIILVAPKGTAVTIIGEEWNGSTKWLKTKSGYYLSAKYTEFVRYV